MYDDATNEVIAEAAILAAAEIANMQASQQGAEVQRLIEGQVESASIAAYNALVGKYGQQEVERHWGAVQARLEASPNLLP